MSRAPRSDDWKLGNPPNGQPGYDSAGVARPDPEGDRRPEFDYLDVPFPEKAGGPRVVEVDGFGVYEPCPPDFNGDASVDTLDVLLFLNAWSDGDPAADFNGDGTVNTLDFLAYLNAWVTGC